jgi:hypothetical protein
MAVAQDPRGKLLIANVLEDFARLSAAKGAEDSRGRRHSYRWEGPGPLRDELCKKAATHAAIVAVALHPKSPGGP